MNEAQETKIAGSGALCCEPTEAMTERQERENNRKRYLWLGVYILGLVFLWYSTLNIINCHLQTENIQSKMHIELAKQEVEKAKANARSEEVR